MPLKQQRLDQMFSRATGSAATSRKRTDSSNDSDDSGDRYESSMSDDSDVEMETMKAVKKTTIKAAASKKPEKIEDKDSEDEIVVDDNASTPPQPTQAGKKKTIEDEYKKMTQLQHILARPDTYIGSIEPTTQDMLVFDTAENKMVTRSIKYVPGLYKIFDEILVNAADNKQRDSSMTKIDIVINAEASEISILNDGKGIPIVMHKEHKIYVPTMIFGHLLTSSNYNDEEKKVTGGRNGYGAKLCNAYSRKFTVETSSSEYKKKFRQTWTDNMSKAGEPRINDLKGGGKDYTKITFTPDLARFGMDRLDDDTVALLTRRAYDIAGAAGGVKVTLNGTRLPINNFKDYVNLCLKNEIDEYGKPLQMVYEKCGERWEVAVAASDKGTLQSVSFVNSIATTKGGKHVDHVVEPLASALKDAIVKKHKDKFDLKPHLIKSHLWVFINCLIENPAFDSQTKEFMTLPAKSFGSKCTLPDKFLQRVLKMGLVENITQALQAKLDQKMNRKLDAKKTNKLRGMAKLDDANNAGTKLSHECTLILTEGDSAKALVESGFGVLGRDRFGVFPLRGKLLNVREAPAKQVMENMEINNIIKILGLQLKRKYDNEQDLKSLRYGHVMIMTDQDADGSHIKGLLINFFHTNWPHLLRSRFVEQFITPIVKVSRGVGGETRAFYSMPEFVQWKLDTADWARWRVKYYKGLGTSTATEAKEYFADMQRHRIRFKYGGKQDDDSIVMAFDKRRPDARREWLTHGMQDRKDRRAAGLPELYLYMSDTTHVSYSDFVNKELILFSNLDNERSIPSLVDGLKPGQRKVIFTCFKRNDKREVKVAQLAGSVAELSAYHHGEQSLMSTIVNLAQDYVGSNNVNLLMPLGQFGTRLQGGNDSASARYIFTMLSPLARLLFPASDEPLLHYLTDDNQRIEPEWYCPILPVVLVNGADGIGTGWSTKIPNYNARDIVDNLRLLMQQGETAQLKPMVPWYRGFRGVIQQVAEDKYLCDGEVALLDDEWIEITELPIGTWTQTYKEKTIEPYLMGHPEKNVAPSIADYKEYHTDTTVRFTVKMTPEQFEKAAAHGFHNFFKLRSFVNTSSMVLFDADGCLQRFTSVEQILRAFFGTRLRKYEERKEYLQSMLQAEADRLSNQARFILEKIDGVIRVENVKKAALMELLKSRGYASDPVKEWKRRVEAAQRAARKRDVQEEIAAAQEEAAAASSEEGTSAEDDPETIDADAPSTSTKQSAASKAGMDYDYLGQMAIYSLTTERKDELLKQRDAKKAELEIMTNRTARDLWHEDLDKFLAELEKQEARDGEAAHGAAAVAVSTTTAPPTKSGGKTAKGGKKKAPPVAKAETRPSATGKRVVPEVDASMKLKVERTKAARDAKAAGVGGRKRGVKKEEDDDDLMMLRDDDDTHLTESTSPATSGVGADEKKSIKKVASSTVDTTKRAGGGGGKKPTKNAEPKNEDDDDKPSKKTLMKKKSGAAGGGKKRKNSWSDESASEKSNSDDDDGESSIQLDDDSSDDESHRKKKAAKKTIVANDDDDEIEIMPKPKNRGGAGGDAVQKIFYDSEDTNDAVVREKIAAVKPTVGDGKKKAAVAIAVDNDDAGKVEVALVVKPPKTKPSAVGKKIDANVNDILVLPATQPSGSSSNNAVKKQPSAQNVKKPSNAAPKAKKTLSSRAESKEEESNNESFDDDVMPAAASKQQPSRPVPRRAAAVAAASKKRTSDSFIDDADSEEDESEFDPNDTAGSPPSPKRTKPAAAVKKQKARLFDEDSD